MRGIKIGDKQGPTFSENNVLKHRLISSNTFYNSAFEIITSDLNVAFEYTRDIISIKSGAIWHIKCFTKGYVPVTCSSRVM